MKAILYTKDFDKKIDEPVDIILSPQFYWIKKIDAPVKNSKEAKKIAKNLFDLDEKNYLFDVVHLDGKYFAVAIEKNLHLPFDKRHVRSIRLAQAELYEYECIDVGDNHSIQKVEDILFFLPKIEKNCPHIYEVLKEINLSNYKVPLVNTLSIDKTSMVLLFAALVVFNLSLWIQGFSYKQALHKLELNKKNLHAKYHLPLTTLQLDAILQRYQHIDDIQKMIKKDLEFFSNTPVKKFLSLDFDGKVYHVAIKTEKSLDSYFKKKFKIIQSYIKNGIYKVKLAHE